MPEKRTSSTLIVRSFTSGPQLVQSAERESAGAVCLCSSLRLSSLRLLIRREVERSRVQVERDCPIIISRSAKKKKCRPKK